MIQNLLLNARILCMLFLKILTNTIQIKNKKKLIVFNDMIADMQNNEKLNKIVNQFFLFLSNTIKHQKMLD